MRFFFADYVQHDVRDGFSVFVLSVLENKRLNRYAVRNLVVHIAQYFFAHKFGRHLTHCLIRVDVVWVILHSVFVCERHNFVKHYLHAVFFQRAYRYYGRKFAEF